MPEHPNTSAAVSREVSRPAAANGPPLEREHVPGTDACEVRGLPSTAADWQSSQRTGCRTASAPRRCASAVRVGLHRMALATLTPGWPEEWRSCTLLSASTRRLSTVPLHELDAVMPAHAGAQHQISLRPARCPALAALARCLDSRLGRSFCTALKPPAPPSAARRPVGRTASGRSRPTPPIPASWKGDRGNLNVCRGYRVQVGDGAEC